MIVPEIKTFSKQSTLKMYSDHSIAVSYLRFGCNIVRTSAVESYTQNRYNKHKSSASYFLLGTQCKFRHTCNLVRFQSDVLSLLSESG